jgi:phenylacetate-CoA ligase
MFDAVTDEQRYPTLTEPGRQMLTWLREHPHAPRYTARCGNRLTHEGLQHVRAFDAELKSAPRGWTHLQIPTWLADYGARCFADVPFYRDYGAMPADFFAIPTTDRDDLSRAPWAFVPDSQPLDDLIVHATSGTTGHPLVIPSHPVAGACYLPLLKLALAQFGITLRARRGTVACILVGYQKRAYTYASVTPEMDDAGFAKINLHPDDWRAPAERARFLDACNPEIYTGDPIAFAELARLSLTTRPRALLSTAMVLLPGLRDELQARFNCPVLDIYSMNETGPIAVGVAEGHAILQHRLYVEILAEDGTPCAPGTRGEITLTGGINPFWFLLRYRTNDYASLEFRGNQPILVGLHGRPPIVFRGARGETINTLDVTAALKKFALPQFTLHQFADGALRLRVRGTRADAEKLRDALRALFGAAQAVNVEAVDDLGDKVMQYTSDLAR